MIFLNSASSAAAMVFYLPGVCTYSATEGKQSPEYFLIIGKNTIFNEHPVYKKVYEIMITSLTTGNPLFYITSNYQARNAVRQPAAPLTCRCHNPKDIEVGLWIIKKVHFISKPLNYMVSTKYFVILDFKMYSIQGRCIKFDTFGFSVFFKQP